MRNEKINYFEVIAKCGHVGKRFYIPIKFAVAAENSKEAAKIARSIPRVKHDHKDAILSVKKISYQEYVQLEEENDKDLYLKCHSKQEQLNIEGLEDRIEIDFHGLKECGYNKESRLDKVKYKLKKDKILQNERKREMLDYAY